MSISLSSSSPSVSRTNREVDFGLEVSVLKGAVQRFLGHNDFEVLETPNGAAFTKSVRELWWAGLIPRHFCAIVEGNSKGGRNKGDLVQLPFVAVEFEPGVVLPQFLTPLPGSDQERGATLAQKLSRLVEDSYYTSTEKLIRERRRECYTRYNIAGGLGLVGMGLATCLAIPLVFSKSFTGREGGREGSATTNSFHDGLIGVRELVQLTEQGIANDRDLPPLRESELISFLAGDLHEGNERVSTESVLDALREYHVASLKREVKLSGFIAKQEAAQMSCSRMLEGSNDTEVQQALRDLIRVLALEKYQEDK